MASRFLRRIQGFIGRTVWLGQLMGGKIPAALYLIKTKLGCNVAGFGRYGAFSFHFRPADLSALDEVLVDREYNFLQPLLKKIIAPVIADIGGHIGLFSIWTLNFVRETRILSVEASPLTYGILKQNVEHAVSHNGSSWKALHGAAWRDGENVGFSDSGNSMSHRVAAAGKISVPGMSLEKIIQQTLEGSGKNSVDLMKIDIEGAEEVFLTNAPEALDRVDALVVELHPNLCDTDKVRRILESKFPYIEEIQGRKSTKPLLFCQKAL